MSEFVPQATVEEVWISLTTQEDNWCAVYDWNGEQVFFNNTSGGTMTIPPMPFWGRGLLEMTLHCLVTPGDSVDRIVIVWDAP